MTVQQQLDTGLGHLKANRANEAGAIFRQVLTADPNNADALFLLGVAEHQSGKPQTALEFIQRAITIKPNQADYYRNLALILAQVGRADEAVNALQRAIQLNPKHWQAHYDLGNVLVMRGVLDGAIGEYRAALAINPQFAEAHQNLGCALQRKGSLDEAEAHLRRALIIQPRMPDAHNNLGSVLAAKMRLAEAINSYQEALKQRPTFAAALSNMGSALRLLGRRAQAIQTLQRAIQLAPDLPEAYNNLGITFREEGRLDESIAVYKKCLSLRPNMVDATNNMGNAYKDSGDIAETIACYGRALSINAREPGIHSNMVYTLQFHPGYDDEALYREQRRWNDIHALPLAGSIQTHDNDRDPERKLRIGYVSAYFYSQAESFFVAPLLENHDRKNFEIHLYSSVIRPDQFTDRLRKSADVWHDVLGRPDANVAEQVRRDKIDVLMDLAMHMSHNRMLLFARKPAPVQVTWLAYPGGTGLDAMDYRITDAYMDPLDKPTTYYREESFRLPGCWCCYDPMCNIPPVPPRPEGAIRFGSINNPCKNNEPILLLWARVLKAVDGSRLLMQAFGELDRNRIRAIFQKDGIAPERIEFVPRRIRAEYLRLYDSIDICLDPLPYNGITTTCDALWMGVPVVTLTGHTAAGRAGMSILSTLGMPEMVAHSPDEYVEKVSALAADAPRLAELRRTLRDRMKSSPMMDGAGFARNMESAYRAMWRKWCSANA
jgi:protein O-GlcNAc transferase